MNGGTSSLKVTVNGKKYLITGIQRETSCKGLLCAIAKVTSQEEELIRSYSQRTSETENLLEHFKGDRKLAGDLTSFNVFNSLAKDAKITVKETATHVKVNRKEGLVDVVDDTVKQSSSKHNNKHSKKQKHQDSTKSKDSKTKESSHLKEGKTKDSTKSKDDKTKDSDKSKSDKTKDNSKTKDDKTKEKKSKHGKRNKNKETLTTTTTTTLLTKKTETTKVKHKIKHRSVDDSDIESYKRDNLKRMRNKRRVYDDSDVEIYKTLQNIVVDQSKKLTRIQGHSRELKKAAWVKELKRGSQIYYLDDKPVSEMVADPVLVNELLPTVSDDPQTGPNSSCSFEKDDGNDSGLPSPEYDSSESQENQTISSSKNIKETVPLLNSKDKNNNNNMKYEISTTTNNNNNEKKEEKVEPANHFSVSNQQENNGKLEQLNVDTLPNINHSVKASNNGQRSNTISESIPVISTSTNGLHSETFINNTTDHVNTEVRREIEASTENNNKNVLQETHGLRDSFGLLNEKEVLSLEAVDEEQGDSEKHMSTTKKKNKKGENSTSKLFNHSPLSFEEEEGEEGENMMIDKNKNILQDSEICERELSKMVAFNEALFKGSNNVNNNTNSSSGIGKKLEKKKFKKCDISDPVLLSPSTLKKHHNVKKVQSVLGKKAADLLRQDVVKSAINSLPPSTTAKEVTTTTTTKEKEKYFNKKLKEIRSRASSKKSKKDKDKKSEPEYFTKNQFVEGSSSTSLIATTSTNNSEDIKTKLESNEDQLTVVSTSSISDKIDSAARKSRSKKSNNTEPLPDSSISPESTSTSSVDQTSDMLDTTGSFNSEGELSEKDVLKADEILNEILEYERNIKNELDQIIQCDGNTTPTTTTTKDNGNEQSSSQSNHNTPPSYETTLQQQHKNNNRKTRAEGDDEEQQHFELIEKYLEEKQALDEISQKLNEYNYMLSRLHDEIQLIDLDECEPKSSGELDEEEFHINHEIENVKSLIQSVVDLTSYQRKEMSENMELLDNIDLEYRTQKANYENLRTGTWRTNSKSAPRSLIKNVKVKRKNSLMSSTGNTNAQSGNGRKSSSFV